MKLRTEGGHFWLTFKNGYTISCFNGYGSYTENHYAHQKWGEIMQTGASPYDNYWESEQIEIGILGPAGDLITRDVIKEADDSVMTITVEELPDIINLVRGL